MRTRRFVLGLLAVGGLLAGCQKNEPTSAPKYTVMTVSGLGGGITATADGENVAKAVEGTGITLTATADEGFGFDGWVVEGVTLDDPAANPATFSMPAGDVTVKAEFTRIWRITVTSQEGGYASAKAEDRAEVVTSALPGERITVSASTDTGYAFVRWIVSGVTLIDPAANPAVFTMPTGNVTIEAQVERLYNAENSVVINGVTWATRNVDAPGTFVSSPTDPGMFYQWNRSVGWSATDPMVNSDGGTVWDTTTPAGNVWTPENDPSPEGWRLPSTGDFTKLLDGTKVAQEWVAKTATSPAGRRFTDKETGNTLFFPAAGFRSGGLNQNHGGLMLVGSWGYYWSADAYGDESPEYAKNMYFGSGTLELSSTFRTVGHCIRPVAVE